MKGTRKLPSNGKGEKCVYLVYGPRYELLGVGGTAEQAHKLGSKYELPFKVLGPVGLNEFIDWETIQEDAFGSDFGKAGDYIDLKDGVPLPEHKEPLTKAQARAIPSHASFYTSHREEV